MRLLNAVVVTAAQQETAVRRVGDASHDALVFLEGPEKGRRFCVPESDGLERADGQQRPIGAEENSLPGSRAFHDRSPGVAITATRRFAAHDGAPGGPEGAAPDVMRSTKSPTVRSPAGLCA